MPSGVYDRGDPVIRFWNRVNKDGPVIRDGLAEEPREVTGPGVTYSGNVANLAGRAGEN